jgi:RND family efflux transporter MFP subunit
MAGVGLVVLGVLLIQFLLFNSNNSSAAFRDGQPADGLATEEIAVTTVTPVYTDFERTTVQPGSVQAFKSAQIYCQVSGVVSEKVELADIGEVVKKGDVLAIIACPDLEKDVQQQEAAVKKAEATVEQLRAKVKTRRAEREAKKAAVVRADANFKSAISWTNFRVRQLNRYAGLEHSGSISKLVVDEAHEKLEAAKETQRAAEAAVPAAQAEEKAAAALVEEAEQDVQVALSQVEVARAQLNRAQVMLGFATIHAPFDGVISERNFFPGDFVRNAASGGLVPLFRIETTDRFRIVVQVPDRDVPYADKGDTAYVEIDAFPGDRFPGKVSRIAKMEDPQTRLMHVEIDLKNENGRIVPGMYGRVIIVLDKSAHAVSLPSCCLVHKSHDGKAKVFVVRKDKSGNERAMLTRVRWGMDNGSQVEILSGVRPGDAVIEQPPIDLASGARVVRMPGHDTH